MKKLKKIIFSWELLTWSIIIIATFLITFFLPWYLADQLLKILLGIFGGASVFWYFQSRKLYLENKSKTTEILRDQKQLRNDQKTIDLIFKNSADGILMLDSDQRIISFSPGMEKMTGYNKGDVLGHRAQQILKFSGDKENSLLPDAVFITQGIKKNPFIRNTMTTKSGHTIDIEASYAVIKDKNISNYKALAIIRDITYEQELIKRDKEFIAITSHQLNTPLSIIRGYVSMLRSGKVGTIDKDQKKYLDQIYDSTKKMINLTNNLLSISRIETDKIQIEKSDINLFQFFKKLNEDLASFANEKNIRLELATPPKDLVIYADEDRFGQVFTNLIFNAIKYTHKGFISVNYKLLSKEIRFSIVDTGIGIPTEDIEKVGQKFYRSQNAIDVSNQGTGLGLFIAKTIIEKHDGILEIKSALDVGTTMSFSIPLTTR
ncbi:MAG: PAS domain-containing sensor histidine kinase [bacterium]